MLGGRENSDVSPTHQKLYSDTTALKSQMVVSTAVNNLIRNNPYVTIIYTTASCFTGYYMKLY
jgi:pyruvate/oxaloacetate carboxyltransferase